jgi:hypothetical protein
VLILLTEKTVPMIDLDGIRAFATLILQTERGGTLLLVIAEGVEKPSWTLWIFWPGRLSCSQPG